MMPGSTAKITSVWKVLSVYSVSCADMEKICFSGLDGSTINIKTALGDIYFYFPFLAG
jgi:hypothetical protein